MGIETVQIGKREIGDGRPVFIVAEVGINHNGDMKIARELMEKAKESGADAVKLQTYETEKRVPKDSPIYDLLKGCELTYDEQRELFALGRDLGLTVFSTPFDDAAVAFLDQEDTPLLKVASFDIVNHALLSKMASCGRPVIMSRGMATDRELEEALKIFDQKGVSVAVLHCISAYPVQSVADLNLSTIRFLKERYQRPVGYSDHTLSIEAPVWAVAAGAQIIEKHFTLSTTMEGPDHAISSDPDMLKKMVETIRSVETAMGEPVSGPIDAETEILQYRRPS
jgi:sialic acid synthase SpsE